MDGLAEVGFVPTLLTQNVNHFTDETSILPIRTTDMKFNARIASIDVGLIQLGSGFDGPISQLRRSSAGIASEG
jgi:hypothetical protein